MKYTRRRLPNAVAENRRLLFVIYFLQGYDREWIQKELKISRATYYRYFEYGKINFKIKSQ